MNKEKIFRVLTLVFMIITFIGAGYVLINKGQVNAGYAVVPSLLCAIFSQLAVYEKFKNMCDYGYKIEIGENFYANHNLIILEL